MTEHEGHHDSNEVITNIKELNVGDEVLTGIHGSRDKQPREVVEIGDEWVSVESNRGNVYDIREDPLGWKNWTTPDGGKFELVRVEEPDDEYDFEEWEDRRTIDQSDIDSAYDEHVAELDDEEDVKELRSAAFDANRDDIAMAALNRLEELLEEGEEDDEEIGLEELEEVDVDDFEDEFGHLSAEELRELDGMCLDYAEFWDDEAEFADGDAERERALELRSEFFEKSIILGDLADEKEEDGGDDAQDKSTMHDNDTETDSTGTEYVEELIEHGEISAALEETGYNTVIDIAIGDRPGWNEADHRHHFTVYDVEVGYVVCYEDANYIENKYHDLMEVPPDVAADWLHPALEEDDERGRDPEEVIDVQTADDDFEEFVDDVVETLLDEY